MIAEANKRIKKYINNTPILYSKDLKKKLGNDIYFKMDSMQKTGSFKIRGVLNHLLTLKENSSLPKKIVSYSTGNHGLAISYVANLFGIYARIYLPKNVLPIKKTITKSYGAEVIEVNTRVEAETLSLIDSEKKDFYYLHPSDDDKTIAGAGTMCYEALIELKRQGNSPNAIFASCGGGGLLAGTYIAKELLLPNAKIIGAEPETANDAYLSLQSGTIHRLNKSPNTIADGLRTLSISKKTFGYLKKLDDFYTCSEKSIYEWTLWLTKNINANCEPSASVSMVAAYQWLKKNNLSNQKVLVLISGGNVETGSYTKFNNYK